MSTSRDSFRSCLLSLLLLTITACSPSTHLDPALLEHLNGRGPVALTPDNPFLAADMLLSKEVERSSEVKGFISHQGSPRAIAVEKSLLYPVMLQFYYPEAKRLYTLEEYNGGWIISGPFAFTEEQIQALISLKLLPPISSTEETPSQAQTQSVTPFRSPAEIGSTRALTDIQESKTQAALLEIVKKNATHPAELSPKGDAVHHVTYPGETLMLISRWYTLDASNAGRLTRINGLTNPDRLVPGDALTIPNYMLKNKYRLTEQAISELKALPQ